MFQNLFLSSAKLFGKEAFVMMVGGWAIAAKSNRRKLTFVVFGACASQVYNTLN